MILIENINLNFLLRDFFNLNTYKLILIDYSIFTIVLLLCLSNRSRIETTCQYCNTFVSFTCKYIEKFSYVTAELYASHILV